MSSFKFNDNILTITLGSGKEIIITKTKKAGKIRIFGTKYLGGDSIYQILIKNGENVITYKSDLSLDQMMKYFSDYVDDTTLCDLLSQLNNQYPQKNKPHHFTGFKEKKDSICSRKKRKEAVKKFKIGDDKYLIIYQKINNILSAFVFYKYQENNNNKSMTFPNLGIRGYWKKMFEISDNEINKLNEIQKTIYLNFESKLTEEQIDHITGYLMNLKNISAIFIHEIKNFSNIINNSSNYKNLGQYSEIVEQVQQENLSKIIKPYKEFMIGNDKYLVIKEKNFTFYKLNPEKTSKSYDFKNSLGIDGNWVREFSTNDDFDKLISKFKNSRNSLTQNDLVLLLQTISTKFVGINNNKTDEILAYLMSLSLIDPLHIEEKVEKREAIKFKIGENKFLLVLEREKDNELYFVFYKLVDISNKNTLKLYKLFGVKGNWIKFKIKVGDFFKLKNKKNNDFSKKGLHDVIKMALEAHFRFKNVVLDQEQINKIIGLMSKLDKNNFVNSSNIIKYKNNKNIGNNSEIFINL